VNRVQALMAAVLIFCGIVLVGAMLGAVLDTYLRSVSNEGVWHQIDQDTVHK
jgi:F0F1-type ATP synthase assembly protein I